jgi:MFS family permease
MALVMDEHRASRDRSKQPSLALLALPTLGLALSITVLTALVPLLLQRHTSSSTLIGAVVSGEGLLALLLPLVLGPLSDRTRSRFGARLPFVMLGTLLGTIGLAALAFAEGVLSLALWVLVFYVGYFAYYPAYRALFPDLVPEQRFGRSQGAQTIFREVGLALALVLGPLAFASSRTLPFLASAAVFALISIAFVWRISPYVSRTPPHGPSQSPFELIRGARPIQRVLLANALWELALSSIKTFVVLFVVVELGRTPATASLLFGIIAVIAVVAAPVAGWLADRFGIVRVLRPALVVYALGLVLPVFTSSLYVLVPAMPLIGFGGAVAMTLPFALLARELPADSHGAGAAVYELSRGVGTLLGPLVTGAAIDFGQGVLGRDHGYDAMWITSALAILLSLPLLPSSRRSAGRGDAGAL